MPDLMLHPLTSFATPLPLRVNNGVYRFCYHSAIFTQRLAESVIDIDWSAMFDMIILSLLMPIALLSAGLLRMTAAENNIEFARKS